MYQLYAMDTIGRLTIIVNHCYDSKDIALDAANKLDVEYMNRNCESIIVIDYIKG